MQSLWVIFCFAQKMLCEGLWEAGREPVHSLLKFIGVHFEVSKSLAIFPRKSIQVLLLCNNRLDFAFHWKGEMSLLHLFCPQLPSLVQDQGWALSESNCATFFSETNYSSNKLLGDVLVISQNTILYHSPKGILYQQSGLVVSEPINQIRPHWHLYFVKMKAAATPSPG